MEKIIFTSDLLKVDDRNKDIYPNPQLINIDWLFALFSKNTLFLNPRKVEKITGMEDGFHSARWQIYDKLGLEFCSDSWALLYEGNFGYEIMKEVLGPLFSGENLVVGFELPPYLIKLLNELNISYIDFTIHPIRFLPDYIFGVRTNMVNIQEKLESTKVPEKVIYDFARISQARTTRIVRHTHFVENSALFLGQIEIDSSLIYQGRLHTLEDIENALIELSIVYSKVYFKAHPHSKSIDKLKKIVEKIKNCQWLEMNIYDALAHDAFSVVATLSSGAAIEAKYFEKNTKNYLDVKSHFDYNNPKKEEVYYPIYQDILSSEYWEWLFENKPYECVSCPDPFQNALRFNLNMKWGR